MLLLALDTSTPAVTAALHDGTRVLAESTVVDARRHGELLAPAIESVLAAARAAAADLTVVAVGVGPGPFTGLRVGVVTALTLAAALEIPVHGICSLDALAWASGAEGPLGVTTDARRREVYWAAYTDRRTRQAAASVGPPADVAAQLDGRPVVGPAAELYDALGWLPATLSAAALAEVAVERLAHGGELLAAYPLYLRRPDATPPGERKRVLA